MNWTVYWNKFHSIQQGHSSLQPSLLPDARVALLGRFIDFSDEIVCLCTFNLRAVHVIAIHLMRMQKAREKKNYFGSAMTHKPIYKHGFRQQNELLDGAIDVKWINLILVDIAHQRELPDHLWAFLPTAPSACVSSKQIISLSAWNYANKFAIQSHFNSFILIDWF